MQSAVRGMSSPGEAAGYIEQSASELRDLAQRSGLSFLAYLLDMARLEAAARSLGPAGSDGNGTAPSH